MADVRNQVAFWSDSAAEDWSVALELIQSNRTRHGLFFAHLGLEKLLKALVVQKTGDLAPRLHNLVRLAELAALPLSSTQIDTLAEMNVFSIEGRYPDVLATAPTVAEAVAVMERG